jgi:uncharacterized protein YajQ (UPF0234 family)
MPSFDIVSKVTWSEVDNALNQANKELIQRFDFKGSNTKIELKDECLTIESADEFKVKQAVEVLQGKLAKRKVPLDALEEEPIQAAGGGRSRQEIKVKSGIEEKTAKAIVKSIKSTKIKVQAAIQGDTVRITGKKRDDLQEVITLLGDASHGQPLQFENFRD